MVNQLVLGGSVALVALGLSAPALMSSRSGLADIEPRGIVAAAPAPRADAGPLRAEAADEAGFLGVAVALRSVDLSARSDGTLERLDVHVGDRVTGGTAIARLDGRSIARDLAMAEAALRVADAEHDRLAVELEDATDRRTRLRRIPELIPREQITAADSQEKMAEARLRSSVADLAGKRARVDQLTEMLRDTQIVAPFDGTIAARYVDAGSTVSRSTPIVRVIGSTSLVIRFAVPEEQAAGVAVGRPVVVRIASLDLSADAVIESIAPEIDAALRMVVVEARLTARDRRTDTIPSGAVARVLFPAGADSPRRESTSTPSSVSTRSEGADHERTAR